MVLKETLLIICYNILNKTVYLFLSDAFMSASFCLSSHEFESEVLSNFKPKKKKRFSDIDVFYLINSLAHHMIHFCLIESKSVKISSQKISRKVELNEQISKISIHSN